MSVSVTTNPEMFKQVKVSPEKVRPVEPRSEKAKPVKGKPGKTPVSSQLKSPPPTELPPPYPSTPVPRFSHPPPQTIAAPIPAQNAIPPWLENHPPFPSPTKPSAVTQPQNPGPIPGPSTQSGLKSPKSASNLLDGRIGDTPGRVLAASKSNPVLNQYNLEPPKLRSDQFSIASTSALSPNSPRIRPERPPPPSSLLNNRPIPPPPPKVKKPGFFARLFGFGKSKSKFSEEPRPTNKLAKPRTSARPTSTAPVNFTGRPTPSSVSNPTSRPLSVATMSSTQPLSSGTPSSTTTPTIRNQNPPVESTPGAQQDPLIRPSNQRQRAVLTKKPNPARQTRHGYQSSVSTRPDRSRPRPSNDNARISIYSQTVYSQSTNSFQSFSPSHATFTAYSPPPDNYDPTRYDHSNHNRTTSATNATHTSVQPHGLPNHPYGPNRTQAMATTNHPGYQPHSPPPGHTPPGHTLCTVCKTNPRYTDPNTGQISPYCTDLCQDAASVAIPPTQPKCSYPGCSYPAVMYPADHHWNYCSEAHEHASRKGCIHCRKAEENGTRLCAECDETFKQSAPTIIPVPTDHDAFWHVVDQFTESWAHPTKCPVVRAVYKIALTQRGLDTYFRYRDTLEYYGQFTAQGKRSGNERVLWHGTRRGCKLGDNGQTTPCKTPECSLCAIIRGSFDIGRLTANPSSGRFGAGIYTSAQASKANDFSSNDTNIITPWKTLLLNNVAAGRECVMYYGDTTLTAPPQGYNSVYGGVGGNLSYDELVVYTSNAIRPSWLVMYNRE